MGEKKLKALIISNGSITDYGYYADEIADADLIICADGGARHASKMKIIPHVLLGDMDSITDEDRRFYQKQGINIIQLPVEKDATDTELAVEYAIEKGAVQILLIGSTGTRLDHTLGNIALLKRMMKRGIHGCILNEHNRIFITDSSIKILRQEDTRISILPVTLKAEGVTTRGLYYELKSAELFYDSTRGISNEFAADEAQIDVAEGELLIILSRD